MGACHCFEATRTAQGPTKVGEKKSERMLCNEAKRSESEAKRSENETLKTHFQICFASLAPSFLGTKYRRHRCRHFVLKTLGAKLAKKIRKCVFSVRIRIRIRIRIRRFLDSPAL